MSELQVLKWSDYDAAAGILHIRRSIWRTKIQATKTEESEGVVPVLPQVRRMLEVHRQQSKTVSPEDYIFTGRRGAPMNLNNLLRRVILPVLEDQKKKHDLPNDKLQFKGWHAFRRGLASNLYSLGVEPKVIQSILRHSDIGTTLDYYVQTPDAESREALQMIEETLRRKPQLGHMTGHNRQ